MDEYTTDARPIQVRIADDLRGKISRGELAPGDKLPSIDSLRSRYKVSAAAVRGALDLLRQEGAIISRKGSGSYVREAVSVRRYGIDRYRRSVWSGEQPRALLEAEAGSQGKTVTQETENDTVPAPTWVSDRLLDVSEGDPVHVRRRVTRLDGVINQSADSYFSAALGEEHPEIVRGEGKGGHIARVNAISRVEDIQEEISSRMPTGPEASRLEIPPGTPVVEVIRTYHTERGPLDVTRFVIRADMCRFDYRFPVPD